MDAYLNPVLLGYVATLQQSLPGSDLRFMTSSGDWSRRNASPGRKIASCRDPRVACDRLFVDNAGSRI